MTNIQEEIWKEIPNYEGFYRVSNLGNVFSYINNRNITLCINSRGYVIVVPNPKNFPQVNHKKGIKHDNRASELEWTNQSGNQFHAYRTGLQKPCMNQKLGTSKHNKENYSKKVLQFDLQGNFIAEFYSASEAARNTNCDQTNISKVCRGEMNKHHNYVWKYA